MEQVITVSNQVIRKVDDYSEYLSSDIIYSKISSFICSHVRTTISKVKLKSLIENNFKTPNELENIINSSIVNDKEYIIVTGSIDARLFIICVGDRLFLFSSGPKIVQNPKAKEIASKLIDKKNIDDYEVEGRINLLKEYSSLSNVTLLIGLYHKTNFPQPRLALGISCMARAIRSEALGKAVLKDMQLGESLDDIIQYIRLEKPNIVGISVTFGQYDLLEKLLDSVYSLNDEISFIVGGSLSSLNTNALLSKYPKLTIGYSSGESTITNFIKFQHGDIDISQVPGISYIESGEIKKNGKVSNRNVDEVLPELDLLDETLKLKGVMQLESSRGCSYACSFCPREHKGIWAGDNPVKIKYLLPHISNSFDSLKVEKKIYLVDEEFFGYNRLSDNRVLEVADVLSSFGFKFETSSRVDQIYRGNKDRGWHIKRLEVWKNLKENGLDRCLFGVESGVDSILVRFNKKTTSDMNAKAIRLISAVGVKTRFTYITFDNLMSISELIETYEFLGRTDLIMKHHENRSTSDIYDLCTSDRIEPKELLGKPFYEFVSYSLVSMENLIGAPYTETVKKLGLDIKQNTQMGRVDANFKDNDIGLFSYYSQMWVDRNFAFDYTLKSMQKISNEKDYNLINSIRVLLRKYSYQLLGCLIYLKTKNVIYLKDLNLDISRVIELSFISDLKVSIELLLNDFFNSLVKEVFITLNISKDLSNTQVKDEIINSFYTWKKNKKWELINEQ
ncbi:radical SAM protein [Vibrio parahaemolyticus]|nr:radical SAM protein [Vibrio parahaemolyticus]